MSHFTSKQPLRHSPQQRISPSSEGDGDVPRHQTGHAGLHPEEQPYTTGERPPRQARTTMQYELDETIVDEDALYDTRPPSSARRWQVPATQGPRTLVRVHHHPIPLRRSRTQDEPLMAKMRQPRTRATQPSINRPTKAVHHVYWLVPVGLVMLVGILLWIVGPLVLHWWQSEQDDLRYGRPRTYQCDARVGHNDARTPSHFLALNLNKHIEIFELPGGDAALAKVYQGPTLIGDGEDLTPVALEFKDVNGDGKPDMIVHVGTIRVVFINDNGEFRPVKPTDSISI